MSAAIPMIAAAVLALVLAGLVAGWIRGLFTTMDRDGLVAFWRKVGGQG